MRYHSSSDAASVRNYQKGCPEDDCKHGKSAEDLTLNPTEENTLFEALRFHAGGSVTRTAVPDFQRCEKPYEQLFDTSVQLKIWGVASRALQLQSPPKNYPEYTKPGEHAYIYRDHEFWTSGFFPGSLYLLLERVVKYEHVLAVNTKSSLQVNKLQLEFACTYWTVNLHQNASLSNTHDLGFMIMPWARLAYELDHDLRAFETIKTAALTLLSRYNKKVGCIRSWDRCVTKKYNFSNTDSDFMVIIDNMMNLDLLFYTAAKTGNNEMFAAAVEHARTTARAHIRPDGSTTHLVVFATQDGTTKHRLTNQGYSHNSCWARGQSWAIAGFAETYTWTHEVDFLNIACRCADYFMSRLPSSGTVPWDFDAPDEDGAPRPSDASAAMIAAYGMLLIHQELIALGKESVYLQDAMRIISAVCANHVNPHANMVARAEVVDTVECGRKAQPCLVVDMGEGDTILKGATINNYEYAPRRWANHGLVYADYYFLLVGNKLLEMGIRPFEADKLVV